MKKKQLLLATAFVTCASMTFAQSNPVVKDGITYSVTQTTIENSGNIANSPSNQTNITTFDNGVSVSIIKIQQISGQKRNITLKATEIDETQIVPGQIISWSEDAAQPEGGITKDYNTNISQFGTLPDEDEYAYEVRTEEDKYKLYAEACEKAIENGFDIVKGVTIPSGKWDTQDMDINPDLYYKRKRSGRPATYTYEAILQTTGGYAETIQYLNGCVDTYYPTTIDAKVKYKVSEADTKLKNGSSNVNIVVGTQCADYQIKDNGDEIFVSKNFTAAESSYERNFKANTFGTVVLPFNISNTADVFEKQGRLTDYDVENNKISCTLADIIVGNTPYLVKITSDATVLEGDPNTPVKATGNAKSGNFNGAQFIGTFAPIKGSELTNGYVVGSDGTIGKLKATSTMKPGRCYFHYEGTINNAKMDEATIELIAEDGTVEIIEANLNGGETTAIDGVVNNSEVVSVQYISIDGQVSNEPVKGMNIVKKTYADGSVETTKVAF